MSEQKIWGTTECVVRSPLYSQHRLRLLAGGYSSVHYHVERGNRFHVLAGTVAVVIFRAWRPDRVVLTVGNTLSVPSLLCHQFQVIEAGDMIEEYWPDRGGIVREDDIVRLSPGGLVSPDELDALAWKIVARSVEGVRWLCQK